ncbi:hypothetical protein MYXO_02314 [Myxococcaceae bacterium]|jgi:hypothetical protein|nr:hypothetical protein MYXO_02314 [Myxococcaceae bacterium]
MRNASPIAFSVRRSIRAVVVALVGVVAIPALAEDTRPKEIPFETPTELPQLDPTYRAGNHQVVLITDQALSPRLVKLSGDQVVAWLSYSSQPSAVVFEREVAKNMTCRQLVNFKLEDDELRSGLMHAGDFASFCELKPGRYTYKIVRPNPGTNVRSAAPKLEGEILVETAAN